MFSEDLIPAGRRQIAMAVLVLVLICGACGAGSATLASGSVQSGRSAVGSGANPIPSEPQSPSGVSPSPPSLSLGQAAAAYLAIATSGRAAQEADPLRDGRNDHSERGHRVATRR